MKASILKRSSIVSAILRFSNSSDKNTEAENLHRSWFNIDEKDSSLLVDYKYNNKRGQRSPINYFAGPHGAFLPSAK
ncbi:hypothetical protein QTN47_07130 [Danxiaibacter flavus]|uniref:Uncharacterized protein n=1 Tax=Danxiaibacter flavus TaxID=3049108 RepID=A0ABV3ZBM1_9BACT|nr:hypothetical protein QNM32_07130 [Chitinophagaceae bacterium DXS]